MKKSLIVLTIILGLVCSMLPLFVSAAGYTGSVGFTQVYYTIENSYAVVIPNPFNINENDVMPIIATDCSIGEGKQLVVSVNRNKTFGEETALRLYCDKGTENEKMMICRVGRSSNPSGSNAFYVDMVGDDTAVAIFNNGSLVPDEYGFIKFVPITSGALSGTYTGTVNFDITVRDVDPES